MAGARKSPPAKPRSRIGQIIARLAGIAGRFATALDCAGTGFLPGGILDELPLPARAGTRRIAGIGGLPALSVPALTVGDVAGHPAPVGLCLVGAAGMDRHLVAAATELFEPEIVRFSS